MSKKTQTSNIVQRALKAGEVSLGAVYQRLDGWVNALTGLGSNRDKSVSSAFEANPPLTPEECSALFHHDDLANTIVSAVPNDAFREGFKAVLANTTKEVLSGDGSKQSLEKAMNDRLDSLKAIEVFRDAQTWGRCYGGGAVLLGVEGSGPPNTPLIEDRVTRVAFIKTIERRDMIPWSYYDNPTDPKYGCVKTYLLQPPSTSGRAPQLNTEVHETRLILFRGATTSLREKQLNGGWDHSVLQKLIDILRTTNSNFDSVRAMMADMSQAVFKIQGLIDMIAEGDESTMETRMALVDTLRSITRAIVLDAEAEDFKLVERGAVTGVGDLLDKTFLRLSSAARMPVSILLGQPPSGLNNTGATDLRWWYDTVRLSQTFEIRPRLLNLVRLISLTEFAEIEPSNWDIDFPPLWQMTPSEEADYRTKVAATDQIYIQTGVVLPEEVTLSRFGRGVYSAEYTVDLDTRKEMLEEGVSFGVPDQIPGTNPNVLGIQPPKDVPGAPNPAPSNTSENEKGVTGSSGPTGIEPKDTSVDIAKTALNGAQVTALLDVVGRASRNEIPRESASSVIQIAFQLTEQEAEKILGSIGKGFTPPDPEANDDQQPIE